MGRPRKVKAEQPVQLVERVLEQQKDMNALTVDKINETAPKAEEKEPVTQLTKKQIAENEGAIWVEPRRRLSPLGTLPAHLKAERDYDWEYVKGIYENNIVNGEPATFWFAKYPGDHDCLWIVPCNRIVYVPRMIAKHLETHQQYHKFNYINKPIDQLRPLDYMDSFQVVGTEFRGKFRAVGAFA